MTPYKKVMNSIGNAVNKTGHKFQYTCESGRGHGPCPMMQHCCVENVVVGRGIVGAICLYDAYKSILGFNNKREV